MEHLRSRLLADESLALFPWPDHMQAAAVMPEAPLAPLAPPLQQPLQQLQQMREALVQAQATGWDDVREDVPEPRDERGALLGAEAFSPQLRVSGDWAERDGGAAGRKKRDTKRGK